MDEVFFGIFVEESIMSSWRKWMMIEMKGTLNPTYILENTMPIFTSILFFQIAPQDLYA
jgi:hypothetical protein